MDRNHKQILLSLAVASVAAYSLYDQRRRAKQEAIPAEAYVSATVTDRVPDSATVIDVSSDVLDRIPGARTAARRAVQTDARDEWIDVTIESRRIRSIIDAVQRELPYYTPESAADEEGVYVRCNGSVVVLNAVGWELTNDPV